MTKHTKDLPVTTKQLGARFQIDKTQFNIWAPTASKVSLVVYESAAESAAVSEVIPMIKEIDGTHTLSLNKNCDGLVYAFELNFNDRPVQISPDPYAFAAVVNGKRSVVLDHQSCTPENFTRMKPFTKNTDAIIYELHIRDLSIANDSGITEKGKFLGVVEKGTTSPTGQSTGLDYIKDLGITHLQLLPIYDYETVDEATLDTPQYNWGYDPENYNVPEGSYSTDPFNPKTRIQELKQMIDQLHENGIRVIMDVVYNHVYDVASNPFQLTVPDYFFRFNQDGTLANGTGVANDVASEKLMVRKYIVDSIIYWAENFHLDGFRFDLMGILDIETMNAVRQALDNIDPSIIVLGEGWDLPTPLADELKATQLNAKKMPNIAHFNDALRDNVKGHVFEAAIPGFINGQSHLEKSLLDNILGCPSMQLYHSPEQIVQYVEAHDNLTLFDKLAITNPNDTRDTHIKRHTLGSSIPLLSQGIAFIHAGQEFLRTKNGIEDSFKSPDHINQFNWSRVKDYNETVEFMKKMIAFRKQTNLLRLSDYDSIREQSVIYQASDNIIIYELKDTNNSFLIMLNGNEIQKKINNEYLLNYDLFLSNDLPEEIRIPGILPPLSVSIFQKNK
ncbi:type I pullulanase [Vagococcus vulneris]|uniref:Type I pullulanase n=1 Tax=Vagococcus vulneris TaxID=1977869 RepID=A0A429ZT76_9ENTE|nr:type I pullulanase [Vagococcus vulneris]RST96935.1 type I pullulanase [Vagococcus vulneris]